MTLSISFGAIVAQRPGRPPVVVAQHRHTQGDVYAALVARVGELQAAAVVAGLIQLKGQTK